MVGAKLCGDVKILTILFERDLGEAAEDLLFIEVWRTHEPEFPCGLLCDHKARFAEDVFGASGKLGEVSLQEALLEADQRVMDRFHGLLFR